MYSRTAPVPCTYMCHVAGQQPMQGQYLTLMILHSVLQLSMLQQPFHQGSHMVAHAEVSQWDTQCPADMLHKCIMMPNLRGTNTLTGYEQMCPLVTCPVTLHATKRAPVMVQQGTEGKPAPIILLTASRYKKNAPQVNLGSVAKRSGDKSNTTLSHRHPSGYTKWLAYVGNV